jgi:hypothetical protein
MSGWRVEPSPHQGGWQGMRMIDKSKDYPDPACADYLQYLPV